MIDVVIKNRVVEAEAVVRLVLGRAGGGALPPFEAGAHIDVHLPSGLRRQYSLCRLQVDPNYYEIAVLKDPQSRGGSEELHQLQIGDSLRISAPRNRFPLAGKEGKSLFIVGGIGVTPLLPMAQTLQCTGTEFEFHYCAKAPETAAFSGALAKCSFADKVHFHYSRQPQSSGRMDVAKVLEPHVADAELYVCGPADFISSILEQARTLGWPWERLHREYFSAPLTDGGHADNAPFRIKIASSGEVFEVEADQSITDVLEKNGFYLPVSCCEGVCGTCLTRLVEGEADHRDVFLYMQEREEGELILPCCSRAKSEMLVLDL